MKNRWRLLLISLSLLASLSLVYLLFHEHEIVISLDRDWDAFLMMAGALILFSLAMVQIALNNADLLRQMSLRRASEEANAEKTRFLRRLDHEMKNPLTAIQAALANMESDSPSTELASIHQTIESQTKRLTHLVRDLRLIGNLEQQDFNPQPVAVRDVFNEIAQIVQEELGTKTLDIHIGEMLPSIEGDYDLLLAALYNLVNNAIKYTGKDGLIRLSADYEPKGKLLVFTVEDNGQGIPPNDLPYVFDELYRSETVREIAGSGIGLALVKAIALRHQGKVSIESVWTKGTKLRFQIPLQHVTDS